jgi:hypothetical protein
MPEAAVSRPRATAPRGRVTLAQAAELAGVSKSAVQRRVAAGIVPAHRGPGGVVTLRRRDVRLIAPRAPAAATRVAVMLRPNRERYAAWARAAGGRKVSAWLGELADQAANGETLRFGCSDAETAEIHAAASGCDLSEVTRDLLLAWARGCAARVGQRVAQLAGRVTSHVEIMPRDPGGDGPVVLLVQFSDGSGVWTDTEHPIGIDIATPLGRRHETFVPVTRRP